MKKIAVILIAVVLTSCGGGGSSASAPTPSYTVSVTATGIPASASVDLYNNGGDALTLTANNTLTPFATAITSGGSYAVTVHTNPDVNKCTVTNGTGTVTGKVVNVSVSCALETYTVTTLAGTGATGSNDGLGSQATFNGPFGIAVDINGNLFVADRNSNMIRKLTPN